MGAAALPKAHLVIAALRATSIGKGNVFTICQANLTTVKPESTSSRVNVGFVRRQRLALPVGENHVRNKY